MSEESKETQIRTSLQREIEEETEDKHRIGTTRAPAVSKYLTYEAAIYSFPHFCKEVPVG